jgi:HEAT repeat protein
VGELVFRASLLLLLICLPAWAALSLVVVFGRLRYDRGHGKASYHGIHRRDARRFVRRATRRPRTDWGRWRRVAALSQLARARHPAARRVLRRALSDPDPRTAGAAVRALGDLGDGWAIELLLAALGGGGAQRSQIAAQLERLAPMPGPGLVSLLRDPDPAVRFWGATLLAPYPKLGQASLVRLIHDPDPNVRAAAVETLGNRGGEGAAAATLALLDDPVWFVRVHAARAAGPVLGAEGAPAIARLLADARWWVRTAAKDALRGIGPAAVSALLPVLTHEDAFARNGAAEVLQDIGYVDALAVERPDSPLLERIYAAGGERLREAAEQRTRGLKPGRKVRAA